MKFCKLLTITVLIIIFFCVLMKKYKYKEAFVVILEDIEPQAAWKYYSDFVNIKRMNPTIIQYKILSGKGNSESQKYSVAYTETLVHVTFVTNELKSYYIFPASKEGRPNQILSTHDTCLFGFCLHSTDKMFFKNGISENTTKVMEYFEYECQLILSFFCQAEFKAQRKLIYKNMKATHKITRAQN